MVWFRLIPQDAYKLFLLLPSASVYSLKHKTTIPRSPLERKDIFVSRLADQAGIPCRSMARSRETLKNKIKIACSVCIIHSVFFFASV